MLFSYYSSGQFVYVIRKRIKLEPEKAIFIFVDEVLPPTAALMAQIYDEYKDEDDFLYVTYSGENVSFILYVRQACCSMWVRLGMQRRFRADERVEICYDRPSDRRRWPNASRTSSFLSPSQRFMSSHGSHKSLLYTHWYTNTQCTIPRPNPSLILRLNPFFCLPSLPVSIVTTHKQPVQPPVLAFCLVIYCTSSPLCNCNVAGNLINIPFLTLIFLILRFPIASSSSQIAHWIGSSASSHFCDS